MNCGMQTPKSIKCVVIIEHVALGYSYSIVGLQKKSMESMARHVNAMLQMQKKGAITFDYGNNLREVVFAVALGNEGCAKQHQSSKIYHLSLSHCSLRVREEKRMHSALMALYRNSSDHCFARERVISIV